MDLVPSRQSIQRGGAPCGSGQPPPQPEGYSRPPDQAAPQSSDQPLSESKGRGPQFVFEDYALELDEETLPWSHVPAGQAELVEGVLLALEAECRAFHLDYPADQALEQLAWLAVAGRRFTRYVEVASRLGTDHWREVEALATSALRSKRRDLAVEVFQAADRPGWHQKLLRERCASLTGVVIGDPDGSRPSLKILGGSTTGSAKR